VFWRKVLKEEEKERLVDNIGSHLSNAQEFIQVRSTHHPGTLCPEIIFSK
jgi:hypothetical protein